MPKPTSSQQDVEPRKVNMALWKQSDRQVHLSCLHERRCSTSKEIHSGISTHYHVTATIKVTRFRWHNWLLSQSQQPRKWLSAATSNSLMIVAASLVTNNFSSWLMTILFKPTHKKCIQTQVYNISYLILVLKQCVGWAEWQFMQLSC